MTINSRIVWIGAAVLVAVVGAGVGGYELGLRAPRPGPTTASISPLPTTASPAATTPVGLPTASGTAPTPSGAPTARSGATWAFDSATGKFVLFGGYTTTGNFNEFPHPLGDTWTWDGKSWTRITSVGPSPRFNAHAVYDAKRRVIVLYGGNDGSNPNGDTWTWDGTRWILMGPSQSPDAVMPDTPMAFDSATGITVLYSWAGVYSAPSPNQTWTWDGANWTRITTTMQPDGNAGYAAMAFDPGAGTVFFFQHVNSGQPSTWVFDGSTWTPALATSGTSSQSFAMAEDDATGQVLLFGENGDTWTWSGAKWVPANPVHSPGPRQGMAMAYDSVHHVVTLFGGHSGTGAALQHHSDVWTWNGVDWANVSGS